MHTRGAWIRWARFLSVRDQLRRSCVAGRQLLVQWCSVRILFLLIFLILKRYAYIYIFFISHVISLFFFKLPDDGYRYN